VGPRSSCRSTRLVGGEIHVEVAPHDVAHLGLVERRAVELVSLLLALDNGSKLTKAKYVPL
jgi:hypothetical protein